MLQAPRDQISYCISCRQKLAPTIANACQRCAAKVGPHVSTENGCVHCRGRALHFDAVTCLGMYDDPLRPAILSAKWSFSSVPIRSLGRLLVREQRDVLSDLSPDLVIPIPQSWQTRLFRRFNAATEIAVVIAAELGIRADDHILRRRRNSRPQKRVPVHQRFNNQADAFRVRDAHMITNKNILLVDDVMTTGATCSEAAKTLKAAGASRCNTAILARVLDRP